MRLGLALLMVLGLAASGWASDDWQYSLRPGDSLWKICERFAQQPQACWRELASRNDLDQPHQIKPGQTLLVPIDWLKEKPIPASLEAVRGEVMLYPAAGGPSRAVTAGDTVNFGDALETSAESSARLRFADQSQVVIKPSSLVVVTRYRRFLDQSEPTELHLERGAIRNRVTPRDNPGARFKVYTPGAAAAVRGTEYYLRVDAEETTRSEVVEGQVDVAASQTTREVGEGFATLARQQQPPMEPVPLLPAPAVEVQADHQGIQAVWPTQAKASGYWLEVYRQPGETLIQQERLTAGEWQADLPQGDYRLLVRAIDGQGLRGHETWRSATVTPPPPPEPEPEEESHWDLWVFLGAAAALLAL